MTRRDYEAIASVLSKIGRSYARDEEDGLSERVPWSEVLDGAILDLSEKFEKENPRFDRDRFATAARKEWGR